MKRYLVIVLIILFTQSFFQNCAKRGRPTGGAKDTIAPVVIMISPPDKSINFESKKIKLKFDEFVIFKDIATQLVVSPPLKTVPSIKPIGASKEFVLTLNDTLKPNTTYTFDFGNSILDLNENNKLQGFKYVFSTGSYLDSLALKGSVADAYERITDKNIAVMLYAVDENFNDSIIYQKKPNYIASTLDSTTFTLNNLKAGKYLMIALKEKNNNYIFNPKSDKIGFVSHLINLPTDSTYHISLHKEFQAFKAMQPVEFKKGQLIFPYEGNSEHMKVKLLTNTPENFKSHISFDKKKDSLYYWHSALKADSLSFEVTNTQYRKNFSVKIGRSKSDSLKIGIHNTGMLHLRDPLKLTSNIPLSNIALNNIKLYQKDTTKTAFIAQISNQKDEIIIDFDKKQFTSYKLKIYPKSITDIMGNTNKDTLNFQFITNQLDSYGNLSINLSNVTTAVIAELHNEIGMLVEQVFIKNNQTIEFKNLIPAKYSVRFILDKNQNNKWDTGNYLQKKQAEKILYFPHLIDVRANWDIIENFSLL